MHASSLTQPNRKQRGASLLDSLVALVVLAGSTVGLGHLQTQLRLGADVSRQRAEANRIGVAEMERLRVDAAFDAASGPRAFDALGDAETLHDGAPGDVTNANYRIVRRVEAASALGGVRPVTLRVQWSDRAGIAREVRLASALARSDASHAGSLALDTGAVPSAPRGAFGRAPSIPIDAVDLGDGRSAWRASATATVAQVFDNLGGEIVARCDVAAAAPGTIDLRALSHCTAARALWVGGTVRFSAAEPPRPEAADDVPLTTRVSLALEGGDFPAAPECSSAAMKTVRFHSAASLRVQAVPIDAVPASIGVAEWQETGGRYLDWHCIVTPRADGSWSGRVVVTPAADATPRRVCRYGDDAAPGLHTRVTRALPSENFLVVHGSATCPIATAALQP